MSADHLEIERKFDAGPEFVLPDFTVVPGCASVDGPVTYHLAATYYDTADQRLAANRITLRRRTGGTDAGWHLKLPAGQDTRRELHEPLGDGQGTGVPGRLASQVADVTDGAPLGPIAVLETERAVRTLANTAGQAIAEIADDMVTARRTGSSKPPMTWREIEIEAGPAVTAAAFEAASQLLASSGARPSASASKLARVLSE